MSCNSHPAQQMAAQTERIHQFLDQVAKKLVVMSGKGGVGKSTVAANLAVTLSRQGYQVGLLDVDVHGPSIAGLLNLTGLPLLTDREKIYPIEYSPTLKVVTVQGILDNPDEPVICRGPAKITMIRQFLGDVDWGPLDFLIIDSPPGTGDEPLTIAQTVTGCQALIVTTPQEIALADVRKSIQFCRKVNLPIAGIIENMSGFVCPTCGSRHDIFKSGGGEKTAAAAQLPFLGRLPIDPAIVTAGDSGKSLGGLPDHTRADLQYIVEQLLQQIGHPPATEAESLKIAIPTDAGKLGERFNHCEAFSIITVQKGQIIQRESLVPPPKSSAIAGWLAEQGIHTVIAGGLSEASRLKLSGLGIRLISGVPADTPDNLARRYLQGELIASSPSGDRTPPASPCQGCNQS